MMGRRVLVQALLAVLVVFPAIALACAASASPAVHTCQEDCGAPSRSPICSFVESANATSASESGHGIEQYLSTQDTSWHSVGWLAPVQQRVASTPIVPEGRIDASTLFRRAVLLQV